LSQPELAERVIAILFGNKLNWFESQCRHIFILFWDMLYTHKHLVKLCSNASVNLNIRYKRRLCSIGRVRNASDADIKLIFLNAFFFVYRHSGLEGSFANGA
jgi:hypothetical protein